MPAPPTTIAGRYRVLEEAGRGGMGSVWRCVDERLGREVAVKQVGRLPGESVTDRARALREARSSAALQHPHVVSVYDAVAEGDHVWLVMEHVAGRTLAEMVRDDGPLSPEAAARIGAQVADGLAAAHARGTVHRDVKPGNVLVRDDGVAKISDFGIARTEGDATLTRTGLLIGTPAYLAPEVARGGRPTPASDVWALGATLFRAVEGRPPYDDNPNALALLSAIAEEEPAAPRRAGVLAGPIRRMLDRDPGSRWSMTEAAHALHHVHDPPSAAPAPVPDPTPATTVPAPARAPVPPPRRRRRGGVLLVAALVVLVVLVAGAVALLRDDPGGAPAADGTSATSPSPDDESPSDTPAEPEPSTPTETSEPPPEPTPATGRSAFVEDYYAALPEDTEAGYARLSPAYRADLSYEEYDGFWSTIDDVQVTHTAPGGPDAVDATLVYDGDEQEVRRIHLERGEGDWLITGDEVVG